MIRHTLLVPTLFVVLFMTACADPATVDPVAAASRPATSVTTPSPSATPTASRRPATSVAKPRTSTPTPTATATLDLERSEGIIWPRYQVVSIADEGAAVGITITVERTLIPGQTGAIVRQAQALATEDNGYFVRIDCASSGARLGNGKFAVGAIGEARTGLRSGDYEAAPIEGAVCP